MHLSKHSRNTHFCSPNTHEDGNPQVNYVTYRSLCALNFLYVRTTSTYKLKYYLWAQNLQYSTTVNANVPPFDINTDNNAEYWHYNANTTLSLDNHLFHI